MAKRQATPFMKYLKGYKIEHRLTEENLAEMLNVSKETVDNWINGRYTPTCTSWVKLIEVLGEDARKVMLEA